MADYQKVSISCDHMVTVWKPGLTEKWQIWFVKWPSLQSIHAARGALVNCYFVFLLKTFVVLLLENT